MKHCALCGELCTLSQIQRDIQYEQPYFPPYVHEGDRAIILSPSSKIDKSFLKGAKNG